LNKLNIPPGYKNILFSPARCENEIYHSVGEPGSRIPPNVKYPAEVRYPGVVESHVRLSV